VPNITPDSATGIGKLTDGQIARMIRYGVRHDGRAALPFMEFNNMNDSDIVAVMSFLRSQAPASHAVEPTNLNWMGKAVTAFMLEPLTPAATPVANRGEYIVDALANCAGCHTQRSMVSGAFTGPRLRGGIPMESSVNAAIKLTPPDLTGNPGGRTAMWTEDEFVARFHAGERIPGSPMPWQAFGRMSDEDVRSIYRYLKSVP
jgi:mono/diheme cytochrome c family protein